jgi:hypothetical protein
MRGNQPEQPLTFHDTDTLCFQYLKIFSAGKYACESQHACVDRSQCMRPRLEVE